MDIEQLIDALEDKIDACTTIPLWGRGIIDKDELLDLVSDIRMKYPDEMKQAKWVKEERSRIISDAQKEAAAIIKAAEEKIAAMVNDHDITQQAYEKANQIVDSAQQNAHEIRVGANQYADEKAMAKFIGADSLGFLSIDGLYRAVGPVALGHDQYHQRDHQQRGQNAAANDELFFHNGALPRPGDHRLVVSICHSPALNAVGPKEKIG